MPNDDSILRCRVCGLLQGDPPWGYDGASPTYAFCPCCGIEFGYQDVSLEAVLYWREMWIAKDGKWAEPKERPANWNLQEQLVKVPAL